MSKKILILNGSPRPRGNTKALIEAFERGAAGHSVTRFDLQKMNIHGCLGCCGGGKDPASPCVQKDGMDKIYPAYQAADEDNFAPVRAFYEGLVQRMGWKSLGIVYAGGNMGAGDIQKHPEQLQEAEELGRSV